MIWLWKTWGCDIFAISPSTTHTHTYPCWVMCAHVCVFLWNFQTKGVAVFNLEVDCNYQKNEAERRGWLTGVTSGLIAAFLSLSKQTHTHTHTNTHTHTHLLLLLLSMRSVTLVVIWRSDRGHLVQNKLKGFICSKAQSRKNVFFPFHQSSLNSSLSEPALVQVLHVCLLVMPPSFLASCISFLPIIASLIPPYFRHSVQVLLVYVFVHVLNKIKKMNITWEGGFWVVVLHVRIMKLMSGCQPFTEMDYLLQGHLNSLQNVFGMRTRRTTMVAWNVKNPPLTNCDV